MTCMAMHVESVCWLIGLSGSAFYDFLRLELPEQALGGNPLGFGFAIEHCFHVG